MNRLAAKPNRKARRRAAPTVDGLEGRIVLSAAALVSIDADGLASVRLPELFPSRLIVSRAGGEYTLMADADPFAVSFEVTENAAGLATSSDRLSLHVSGIAGLTIDVESMSRIWIVSSDVPTTIHLHHEWANVEIGGGYGTRGLKDVTAPVVVDVSGFVSRNREWSNSLLLNDSGSTELATYTITSNTVEATGGFGGVAYSGVSSLEVDAPAGFWDGVDSGLGYPTAGDPDPYQGTTRFIVQSTHAGVTVLSGGGAEHCVFDVDADMAPDDRAPLAPWVAAPLPDFVAGRLTLMGGGAATYNIRKTPSPVTIVPGAVGLAPWAPGMDDGSSPRYVIPTSARYIINLTADGTTSGIRHDVTIDPDLVGGNGSGPWYADVVIDDSAGAVARDASFGSDLRGSRRSILVGTAENGARIILAKDFAGNVYYNAPKGLGNAFAVDLAGINAYPGTLTYDAGAYGGSDRESRLTLFAQAPSEESPYWWTPTPTFARERHVATGSGSGAIDFQSTNSTSIWSRLNYRGLSPGGLVDLVPASEYDLSTNEESAPGIVVQAGEPTADGVQTLLLTSRNASPGFAPTTIANKRSVTIHANGAGGLATLVDYRSEAPPAGLEELTIHADSNDQVDVTAPPPGVAASVITPAVDDPPPTVDDPPPLPSPLVEPPSSPDDPAEGSAAPRTTEGVFVPSPIVVGPTAPTPDAEVLGAGRALQFRPTMRDGRAVLPTVHAASRLRNLRAVRMGRLEAIHSRRLERAWAAHSPLRHAPETKRER